MGSESAFYIYCHEGEGTIQFMNNKDSSGNNDKKKHEIAEMGFRKKKRNVAVVLTLSAVAAVTVVILAQNGNLQGVSHDLASSARQENAVKGMKTSV